MRWDEMKWNETFDKLLLTVVYKDAGVSYLSTSHEQSFKDWDGSTLYENMTKQLATFFLIGDVHSSMGNKESMQEDVNLIAESTKKPERCCHPKQQLHDALTRDCCYGGVSLIVASVCRWYTLWTVDQKPMIWPWCLHVCTLEITTFWRWETGIMAWAQRQWALLHILAGKLMSLMWVHYWQTQSRMYKWISVFFRKKRLSCSMKLNL